jgi:hypothetical protein
MGLLLASRDLWLRLLFVGSYALVETYKANARETGPFHNMQNPAAQEEPRQFRRRLRLPTRVCRKIQSEASPARACVIFGTRALS